MDNTEQNTNELYENDEYIRIFPELFESDADWKLSKLIPLLDQFAQQHSDITTPPAILDVGGGSGKLLKLACTYLQSRHALDLSKYAIDLSPGMLSMQQQTNPNLIETIQSDICQTPLNDKQIDLTLMIDVLEHVPNIIGALNELKRISHYVLLKVPLEDNAIIRLSNRMNGGKTYDSMANQLGHINRFSYKTFVDYIKKYLGEIITLHFTNAFEMSLRIKSDQYPLSRSHAFIMHLCKAIYPFSPRLASGIFTDFVVVLVKCK